MLKIASDVYSDYQKAASEGNGIVLFKNRSKSGINVYAYNAGAPIKWTTQFTSFIAPGKVGVVPLPNPLPLISSLRFGLYVNK